MRLVRVAALAAVTALVTISSTAARPFASTAGPCPHVYSVALGGSGLRNLSGDRCEVLVSRTPDRTKMAVIATSSRPVVLAASGELWVMGIDGSNRQFVAENVTWYRGVVPDLPRWSGDGRRLVYTRANLSRCRSGGFNCALWEVYLAEPHGSQRLLAGEDTGFRGARDASWSGNRGVVLSANIDFELRPHAILLLQRDGQVRREVATSREPGETALIDPTWSPNGRWVAYVRSWWTTAPHAWIFRRRPGGGRERRLTRGFAPAWSPDSRRIAFARQLGAPEANRVALCVMNSDGKRVRRLTSPNRQVRAYAWSRGGKRLAVVSVPENRGFETVPPVRIDVFGLDGRRRARIQPRGLGDPGVSAVFLSRSGDRVFFTAAERP